MRRVGQAIALVAFAAFVGTLWMLSRRESGGPAHIDMTLSGGLPATFYLPGKGPPFFSAAPPKPAAERPPGVVLVHGFAADRAIMSTLARRLARNGIAVLAIDVRGHGANRNAFEPEGLPGQGLHHDIWTALAYLHSSPMVDGSRLAVVGHSMGAGAALDYATRDASLKATVMISGGWSLEGPERPHNALFIFASHDPENIKESSMRIAAKLGMVDEVELGRTYGNFGEGTAVRAIRVPCVDHLTILWSPLAAHYVLAWLDVAFGIKPADAPRLDDPRLAVAVAGLAVFVVLLAALGATVGGIAPRWERRPAGWMPWAGLVALAFGLAIAMPLIATHPPAFFLSLFIGDEVISWMAVAGAILLGALALDGILEWQRIRDGRRASVLAAVVAMAAIYVMMTPLGVVFHRLALTPERLLIAVAGACLLLPFFLAFEILVRRGGVAISTIAGVLGRTVTIGVLFAGITLHVIPFVVVLMIPSLAVAFVMFEIFAASVYAASGNLLAIATVEAAWLAWIAAAVMPVTIMF